MSTFEFPEVKHDCWGPPSDAQTLFSDLPFVPFSKRDVVNYVADWFGSGPARNPGQRNRGMGGDNRKRVGEEDAILTSFGDDVVDDGFKLNIRTKNYEKDAKTRKDSGKQAEKMITAHQKLATKAAKRIEKAAVRHMSKSKRQFCKFLKFFFEKKRGGN
ncbi:hypothetical protein RFI_19372 [Reticulomyxa filosa]|uniref:Uncharacterized protein n=1 Tax=Reticulomyxa filosa TaxID=46433 RepID=X6MVC5_RETFI|nr:hypothetical protein RFI_19372 [Reticulomyxa filosa]|eukprot:ETO17933.1 hypothetical protein RFI_19372 [Reticulomyxa filosa]